MPCRPRVGILANLLEYAAALAGDVATMLLTIGLVVFPHTLGFRLDWTCEVHLSLCTPLFHLCYLPDKIVVRILQKMSNTSGLTDKEEVELLYALKQLPDFDCLPIPAYWFEKYKLAPRAAVGPKEYIESNHAMKMAVAPKDLPPIIIDEPQQGGKLVTPAPFESVPVELRSRPFVVPEGKPFPAVIVPTYEELGIQESQRHMSPSSGDQPQSDPLGR